MTSSNFATEHEQSFFQSSTMTSMTDEQTIDYNDYDTVDDDDDDNDSFEVLSFEAPPENTIYIKGYFQHRLLRHFFVTHFVLLYFSNRIRTYNSE